MSAVLALVLSVGAYLGPGGDGQAWVAEALAWGAAQKRVDLPVTLVVAGVHLKPSGVETLARPMSVAALGGDMRYFEGRELKAVFPLSQPIPAEAQVIVEYSWVENGNPKHTERKYTLGLGKTKW